MTISISDRWTEFLLTLPETGMGCQIVEVSETGRQPIPAMVLNADRLAERLGRPMVVRERPVPGEAERLETLFKSAPQTVSVRLIRSAVETGPGRAGGAADAELDLSKAEEKFLRYSAFRNDRRILPDGSLLPGTYATTWADGRANVKTGSQAVRRYALPNPDPAVHEFELKPPRPVPIRCGIAQPAFGQPGGGVEIIFDGGAPPTTLNGHRQLPP